ncbi:MAG: MlaD family protein [Haloechinothrix sp.]
MTTPEARRTARSVRVGLVLLALTVAAVWMTFEALTGWPFAPTTEVRAAFDNVHSLKVNDDVRQNSKRIGRVSDVEFAGDKAIVTMELSGNRDVFANAHAALWDQSALATKFVELDPGTAGAGPLGDRTITSRRTVSSTDLYQLLDTFDAKTRKAVQSYLRQGGGGMAGHGKDLNDLLAVAPDLLGDAGTVSSALAAPEADLPDMLRSADRLTARFAGRTEELGALVEQSDSTLRAFSVDGARPLSETIEAAPGTLRSVRAALDRIDTPLADTESAMRALRPGADDLSASTEDLRAILREGARVAPKMPPVLKDAKPVVEDLTATVSKARPLGPRLVKTTRSLAPFIRTLAPYGPEIGTWAVRGHSFLSQGPAPGIRYARLSVVPSVHTVTGQLYGSADFPQNEYPAPGESMRDRDTGGMPPGLLPGGTR